MTLIQLAGVAPAISAIVASLGFVVGVVTAVRGYLEYVNQNALKRFEKFQELRRRFKENEEFRTICYLLDTGEAELRNFGFKAKRDFLGFFEEVALAHNSKLVNDDVAHYMFGYYAVRCYESQLFWAEVNRESYYWSLFTAFAKKMRDIESRVVESASRVEDFHF